MKTKLLGVFAAAALVFAVAAYGQEGPPTPLRGGVLDAHQFQGQLWSYTGTFSPLERNNVLSQTYAEQSISIFTTDHNSISFTPYAAIGFSMDTHGNSWDRSIQPSFGIKVNKLFRHGVISGGT